MPSTRNTISFFAVGAALIAAAVLSRGREGERTHAAPTAVAERRDLEVTLVEPGTLEAARSVTLASEIRSNRAKIVSIAAEGSWLEIGDLVIAFDRTPFEEDRLHRLGELRDAEAAAARAEQERKLEVAKSEQALESARHGETLARLALESFEKGNGALGVREAEVRAAQQNAELARSRSDLTDLDRMAARGFVSQGELERQRLKVEELERQNGLASDKLKAAREVVYPRDLERARIELQEARDALARAEAVLHHTHEFYEAALAATERKVESSRTALQSAEEEIGKTTIAAPIAGFLILQDIPLENGKRRPQVGDSVWSGQPVATIPDLSQMVVLTRVREVDLHRLQPGAPAGVELEAYPDVTMNGRVDFIGSLAESAPDSPWKFFTVRLAVDRTDPRLRPGMSVRVAFRLAEARSVVVAPVDALFPCGDRRCVYARRGGEVWEQPVTLGLENETHVEVRSGLSAGEELLLAAPSGPVRHPPAPPPGA